MTVMPSFRSIIPHPLTNLYTERAHSPGVVVGSLVIISGMLGRDENLQVIIEPEAQLTRVFENIGIVLKEAGCTWQDVVELTGYFTHLRRDFDLFLKVRRRFIDELHPAMTMVGVAELAHPDLFCEVKGIAILPGS